MYWLIKGDVLDEMRQLAELGAMPSRDKLRALVDRDFEASHETEPAAALERPRILTVAGSEAEIVVEGPLVRRRMGYVFFYDRPTTSYQEIEAALAVADKDPNVRRATMRINSPGGEVDGIFDAVAAIEAFSKPIVARVVNAYSGGYILAAACDRIEATGPGSMFGSVGVAARFSRWTDQVLVDITNTDSPDKRPDPTTAEGQAVIRRELDAINDLIVDAVARGRTKAGKAIKASEVSAAYGSGASFPAAEARRRKMIDAIGKVGRPTTRPDPGPSPLDEDFDASTANDPAEASASGTEPAEGGREPDSMTTTNDKPMTLERLRAEYPGIFQAARDEGYNAGVEAGATAERERVTAHLTLGEASGEDGMKFAVKAIREGVSASSPASQAEYMAAHMRGTARDQRQDDTDAAAAAVSGAPAAGASSNGKAEPDMGDKVADALGLPPVEASAAS